MIIVKKNRDIDLMMAVISKKTVTFPNKPLNKKLVILKQQKKI